MVVYTLPDVAQKNEDIYIIDGVNFRIRAVAKRPFKDTQYLKTRAFSIT